MRRFRIIPSLLLSDRKFVKTTQFEKPKYVGDPINTIRIFNEKGVDELAIVDINATSKGAIDFDYLKNIAYEAFVPLAYGGGLQKVDEALRILKIGYEKVIIGSRAYEDPRFIRDLVATVGAQSVVVSVDVKKSLFGTYEVRYRNGSKKAPGKLDSILYQLRDLQVGEIIVNNINKEGTMEGYDQNLLRALPKDLGVPLIVNGGAKSFEELVVTAEEFHVDVAAGALFVYSGVHRGVLISYPNEELVASITSKRSVK